MSRVLGRGAKVSKENTKTILSSRTLDLKVKSLTAESYIASPYGVIYNHEVMGFPAVGAGSSFIPNGHAVNIAIRNAVQDLSDNLATAVRTEELSADYIAAPYGVISNHEVMGVPSVGAGSSFIPNGHAVNLAVTSAVQSLSESLATSVGTREVRLGQITLSERDGALCIDRLGEPLAQIS